MSCDYTQLLHDKNSQRVLNWKQTQQKVNHCCKEIRKGEKEGEKKLKRNGKNLKTYFDFCVCCSKDVLIPGVSGKKGMLHVVCCKCLFEQIRANLSPIQARLKKLKSSVSAWVKEGFSKSSHGYIDIEKHVMILRNLLMDWISLDRFLYHEILWVLLLERMVKQSKEYRRKQEQKCNLI